MRWTYLLIDIFSILVPFLYSFHPKMKLIQWWKPIFIAISLTAIPFLAWDVFFTVKEIWGFNPKYLLDINFLYLPLEEWLFFWMIPYASLFIYYSFQYFKPNWVLSDQLVKIISILILFLTFGIVFLHYDKGYTLVNYATLFFILLYAFLKKRHLLKRFFVAYLVVLIPFVLVNGTLTGMWTEEPIVWYNDAENLGLRFITIPVEDFAYAFSMLLLSLILIDFQVKIEWDKPHFNSIK